jgi:hypothetical protein
MNRNEAIAAAKHAATERRDDFAEQAEWDMSNGYEVWHGNADAQRDYVAMIGQCELVTTNVVLASRVTAYAPQSRAGQIHGGGILTLMLEAFSAAYPGAEDGRIDSLSDTCQVLTW